jgi:hypothetical protein
MGLPKLNAAQRAGFACGSYPVGPPCLGLGETQSEPSELRNRAKPDFLPQKAPLVAEQGFFVWHYAELMNR